MIVYLWFMAKKFKEKLFKVARDLNVTQDTIVQHLEEAGYGDALSGSGLNASIIDEDAYQSLLQAFAADRAVASRVKEKRAARQVEAREDQEGDREVLVEEIEEPAPVPKEVEVPIVEKPIEPEEVEKLVEAVAEEEVEVEETEEVEITATIGEDGAATEAADVEVEVPEEPEAAEAEAPEEEETAAPPPTEAEAPEEVPAEEEQILSAKRYQLAGTKVLGKVDLAGIEEDKPKRKRKRKRKKKAGTEETPAVVKVVEEDAEARAAKKKRKRKRGPAVDEEDVEQTLQQTLRELEMGASRSRALRRRSRRERHAEKREAAEEERLEKEHVLRVTEFVSTGELANLMSVPVNEVISTLFKSGMIVSINQRLDADTISFVADEFGYGVEFITDFGTEDIILEEDREEDLADRAPIVTVMGHVDHGKTSLLDYIRRANVVAGEAGGITQHIGAYQVETSDRNITFLDTPGHEAFTAMRARGAKVTDIVVLVVAADDAVMPQTIEAINHAKAADVPIVVAINKIDKPDSNAQRVMQQLADHNVLVEQYGGKAQCALVSAKSGEGVDDLLEKILLEADLQELKANPNRNADGIVIEARLEKGRGNVATVLVQNGTLKVGDPFVAGIHSGRVRAMFDERDNRIDKAGPAQPALVLGFAGAVEAGDQFVVLDDEKEAKEISQRRQQIHREQSLRQKKHITLDEIGRRLALGDFRELNLIIKADVGGSVEALADSLLKLSTDEVALNIIHSGVGAITESDVMLASASDAVIIGFQVRPAPGARVIAEREEIDIRLYSVIYDAIEDVHDALEGLLSPTQKEVTLGTAEVRDIFKVPKAGTVAGCYVIEGKIRRNERIRVVREGVVIYDGGISSLKRFKDDVREVQSGYECGISIENFNDIKVGDHLETYEVVEEKRTLEVR